MAALTSIDSSIAGLIELIYGDTSGFGQQPSSALDRMYRVLSHEFFNPEPFYGPAALCFFKFIYMLSFALSLFIITTVIVLAFLRPDVFKRPSVRLSGSIAVANAVYALISFLLTHYPLMSSLSQLQLATIFWLRESFPLILVLLNDCIVFHLQLTVLMRKTKLAKKFFYPGYEVFSFVAGLAITAYVFKFKDNILWKGRSTTFYLYTSRDSSGGGDDPSLSNLFNVKNIFELVAT
ncbi:hypothetical protein H4219_005980 [Mycoemilia scoparia]|uniref:Uncharacterized protein n=1 Tax=Mycoemilia scoparia TaxID=417184 RepID=A0A9W7ZKH3_9FUNG|nr:hypothetical protein H4219_005980 [Mycoemilia scoparia]